MTDTIKSYIYKTSLYEKYARLYPSTLLVCVLSSLFYMLLTFYIISFVAVSGKIFFLSIMFVVIALTAFMFISFVGLPKEKITEDRIKDVAYVTRTFPVDSFSTLETNYKVGQNIDPSLTKIKLKITSLEDYFPATWSGTGIVTDMAYIIRNNNQVSLKFRPFVIDGKYLVVDPELVDVIEH